MYYAGKKLKTRLSNRLKYIINYGSLETKQQTN